MNKDIEKIILLLASSNVSPRALRELAYWLHQQSPNALEDAVMAIRHQARNIVFDTPSFVASRSFRNEYSENIREGGDHPAIRIDRLLRQEANLSARQASQLLFTALVNKEPLLSKKLPILNKEKFTKWIERVSHYVPYSIILHEATIIRNKVIHSDDSDWPLQRKSQK